MSVAIWQSEYWNIEKNKRIVHPSKTITPSLHRFTTPPLHHPNYGHCLMNIKANIQRLALCFLLSTSFTSFTASAIDDTKPFQLALFNPIQLFSRDISIHGLRINIIHGSNFNVNGIDIGISNRIENEFRGLEIGLFSYAEGDVRGIQIGLSNNAYGNVSGYQVGLIQWTDGDLVGGQEGFINFVLGDGVME